jgi:MFS family permease
MHGDPAMNRLGWMFYRNTPLLQHPFGANWPYGMQMGNSAVFADFIPLMAFLFKPFSPWLLQHFQDFGLWTLICYLLQAFFAWLLLGRISDRLWRKVLATSFFVLAPTFLWRIGGHFQLGAQWVILAALCLYFSPRFRPWLWLLLLTIASLITPILMIMALLIYGAAILKQHLDGELPMSRGVVAVALTGIVLYCFLSCGKRATL